MPAIKLARDIHKTIPLAFMLQREGNMIRFIFAFVVALIALPLQAAPKEPPSESYRLGVFPYMAPRQIVELYGPIAASMETVLKHPVRLESAATFPDFGRNLEERSYDIALIQPFDYPNAIDNFGYLPLAQLDAPVTPMMPPSCAPSSPCVSHWACR